MQSAVSSAEVPSHVAPELVYEFRFENLPGVDVDAVQAAIDAARAMPDIFFGLGSRKGAGAWVLTRHELQREVLQDGATFSSHNNADFSLLLGEDWPLLPLNVDGAEHLEWRKLLNPIFSPRQMAKLETAIQKLAQDLVDGFADKGEVDFMKEFGSIFPVQIFLEMFGLPLEHAPMFIGWSDLLVHGQNMDERIDGARQIVTYLRRKIAERTAEPTDDLISYVVTAQVYGRGLTDDEKLGVCFLLYSAGLDTVANMLGFIFKYLAEHPEQQQLLRDDPSLIPNAVEELMRAFPIIITGRLVTRDIVFHGVQMRKGDTVCTATTLAGRDEREFPEPDRIDFTREKVNHISFAAGAHRCIGSHLARRELKIAIETWLNLIPPFRIADGERAITSGLNVLAVEKLPLTWG
jgi:cytochrome P450